MIDFHSHILPRIDDGSRSVEETFNLIKEAKQVGFDAIISTSHYIEKCYESKVEERRNLINAISQKLKENDINIKIYLGNEMYITENMISLLADGKGCTINNSNYVLFEIPLNSTPANLYDVIYDMQENKLVPVLAHPERYSYIQNNPNVLNDLIEKGILLQSNYGSIIGQYGEKAKIIVTKMFENNMVHFLGSDVHRQNTVYTNIPTILNEIEEIIGKRKLNEIVDENPRCVLENKRIDVDTPRKNRIYIKRKIYYEEKIII